jgi:hypothetical protein
VIISYYLIGARPVKPWEWTSLLPTDCRWLTSMPVLIHSVNYQCLLAPMHNFCPLGPTTFVQKELGRTVEWIIFNNVPGVSKCMHNGSSATSVTSHQIRTTMKWCSQVLHQRHRRRGGIHVCVSCSHLFADCCLCYVLCSVI